MPWAKIDDQLSFHPKTIQAGNEAMGVWVRALSYACQHLTDGFISNQFVVALNGEQSAVRLVDAGLWIPAEGGFVFKDFHDYQPSSDSTKNRRDELARQRSEAGKRGALTRWNGKTDGKPMANDMANDMANEWQTVSQNDSPVPVPDPIKNSIEDLFEKFWSLWPRKEGKATARKSFVKAVKSIPADELMNLTQAYLAHPQCPPVKFLRHASTWLNQEGWADDLGSLAVDDRNKSAGPDWMTNNAPWEWQEQR